VGVKLYELKKGDKIIYENEILEFEEIRGDKIVFLNEYFEEKIFPDYLDLEEIGELFEKNGSTNYQNAPTLF
jgi:hypothetical protein